MNYVRRRRTIEVGHGGEQLVACWGWDGNRRVNRQRYKTMDECLEQEHHDQDMGTDGEE
jgi:hypothetical protein